MRRVVSWVLVAVVLALLALRLNEARASYRYGSGGTQDLIAYWTASRLLFSGHDPYDAQAILAAEKAQGRDADWPMMTWNPPWLLVWVGPLAALPFLLASVTFIFLNLALTAGCAHALWRVFADPEMRAPPWLPHALALGFYPVLFTLAMGQLSIVILAGLTGFFVCASRGRDFGAGLFLALTSVKPHVIYLVWLAAALWALSGRRWRFFVGVALPIALSVALLFVLRPTWLADYRALSARAPVNWFPDTLGGIVRWLTFRDALAIQIAPSVVTAGALLAWLVAKRPTISWREGIGPLVAVSTFTAFYGWCFDQSVLVVPILAIAARLMRPELSRRERLLAFGALAAGSAALAIQNLAGILPPWDFWTPALVLVVDRLTRAR